MERHKSRICEREKLTEVSKNSNLSAARKAKQDEFYTQWADIEREINAYLEYDPNVFRDKTILLPCDDPEWSNFTKFFALHFQEYGLKRLISTSYAPNSNAGAVFYQPTMFELDAPQYNEEKSYERGRVFTLSRDDADSRGRIDIDNLKWDYLKGDGDFQSQEVTQLRDQADIVITNPPFSLFRTFLAWLIDGNVLFSVIGNSNAVTYRDVFPLVKENEVWKGATANNTDMVFSVPAGVEVKESDQLKAERLGYPSNDEVTFTRLGNSCWFTNIEHGRRHEPIQTMTMEDNKRFNKKVVKLGDQAYPTYDNYNAIEVGHTDSIPSDYPGLMGVPISFLDKYNPEQFEILGSRRWAKSPDLLSAYTGPVKPPENDKKTLVNGRETYDRIFIRHLHPNDESGDK